MEGKGAEEADATWKSNLNRQLAEVEVLRSIYGGEGEFELNNQEEAILESLLNMDILLKESRESIGKSSGQINGSISSACSLLYIKRVLIWFHHIKSLQKRKSILEWGKELNLGGYCKPGFPGIIIVEGEKCDVDTYVKQLQNLRWQAMSVRGEEQEEVQCRKAIDDVRHFLKGVKELDEHGMSELGCLCQEANLEHLFLSALKINR